jgi:glycosyltransferase involved in cell wall biosynthesis/2-polyprenyl-3-methyl-5-hydroxy-6-metoxy-1,4-benzoquinol methylase
MPAVWAFLVDSVPFTKATRDGETSLGGSESACLGLARALKRRGHEVHVFATKLAPDAAGPDAAGVVWHPLDAFNSMNQFIDWDVVVGLRMFSFFADTMHARLKLLWNQDLLMPGVGPQVMSLAWNLDRSVYVSEYHRQQWEDQLPELASIGWATKNGFDPQYVPANAVKDPQRIIHISRPERGLAPLLAMWPALRARVPDATLQICRYASMYDGEGSNVRAICESFDEQIQRVNAEVGGITYLGSLNKPQLYQAIAESAVMWYPGIAGFAETSCIAAVESQACGTPFVGSLKGALAETARPSFEAGLLLAGDAERDRAYQAASIDAVVTLLNGCATKAFAYRKLQQAGRAHVQDYTYDAIAAEWEQQVEAWFRERYEANKLRVMQQLLHEDDHTAAMVVAHDIAGDPKSEREISDRIARLRLEGKTNTADGTEAALLAELGRPEIVEAAKAFAFCERVIQGKEQTADDYAAHAIQDPLAEVECSGRIQTIARMFEGRARVLDIACGNGAGAIAIALANPEIRVVGIDYAAPNIDHARAAAEKAGVADRCTFIAAPVWDFDTDGPSEQGAALIAAQAAGPVPFDGLFVGEFVEHIADCTRLVDWLETFLAEGAFCVYTCPVGPFGELVPRGMPIQRGHVHCFKSDDVAAVWGKKREFGADFFGLGQTPRLAPLGHWLIHYRTAPNTPAGERNYEARVVRTRPLAKLSIGMIARDAENDLARCLTSVWNIADEIVIGDTGSTDTTKAIAAAFGARVIDLDPLPQQPDGFAGARNAVLDACTGDWFLWIDADEQLIDPHLIPRYLQSSVYHGFVLHQHHLMLDAPASFDIPVRLFRRSKPIRFYGCIHEQPQMGDCNTDILPTLELFDARIAHVGYLTEGVRREKMLQRNLPLLRLDQERFPERELGKVLVLRDYVNLSDYDCEAHGGRMTTKAQRGYAQAIRLFLAHFDDPAHRFHGLARPWYQIALQRLGMGFEVEIALAGRAGGLEQRRAKPERIWVRDADEFERYVTWKTKDAAGKMRDVPVKTDPFVLPAVPVAVSA